MLTEPPRPYIFPDAMNLSLDERMMAALCFDLDRYPNQSASALRRGGHLKRPKLMAKVREIADMAVRLRPLLERGMELACEVEKEWAEYEQRTERYRDLLRERHIYMGCEKLPTSYSIFGTGVSEPIRGKLLATSLDGGQVILSAGMPGAGKSQAALVYLEGALLPSPTLNSLNELKRAGIAFHTDPDGTKLPQLLEALKPNSLEADQKILQDQFMEGPIPIGKLRVVVPWFLCKQYEEAFQPYIKLGLEVRLLHLPLSQIGLSALEILIGAEGDDPAYVSFILQEAARLGDDVTVKALQDCIETSKELTILQKQKAQRRLRLLEAICDPPKTFPGMGILTHVGQAPCLRNRYLRNQEVPGDLWDMVTPGSTTIFVLAGQRIGSDVMPLTAMLMSACMQKSPRHGGFQRLFILDEINNLDGQNLAWGPIMRLARQIRHQGSCLLILGQDFFEIPPPVFALATMYWVFCPGGPNVIRHLKQHAPGFEDVRFEDVSELPAGTGLVVVRGSLSITIPPPKPPKPEKKNPLYFPDGLYQNDWSFGDEDEDDDEEEEDNGPILNKNPFGTKALLVQFRPPRPMHGGHTKAVF